MRFKCVVLNPFSLISYLSVLEKLSSETLLTFTEDKIYINSSDNFTKGEQAFVEIPTQYAFTTYIFERRDEHNCIPCTIVIANLLRALRSGSDANSITLKLSRRGNYAVIDCIIKNPTVEIAHSIPIVLEPAERFYENREPIISETPTVQLSMPSLISLKAVIDRMKSLGTTVKLRANNNGELTCVMESDMVTIRTYYRNLAVINPPTDSSQLQNISELKMSLVRLSRILACKLLESNALKVVGCFIPRVAFVLFLHLNHNQGTLTYYVPLIAPGES